MAYGNDGSSPLPVVGGNIPVGSTYVYSSKYIQGTFINHLLRSASATGSLCYLGLYYQDLNGVTPSLVSQGVGYDTKKVTVLGGGVGDDYMPPPVEISGSGYSRVNISGSFLINDTTGSASNNSNIFFPLATASWGTITHLGILNGSSSGSFLFYGPLSASLSVGEGEIVTIPQGRLKISLALNYSYYSGSKLLAHYLNNTNYPAPVGVTCALFNTLPSASGGGGTEVSGGGYARKSVGWSASWVNPFPSGSTSNTQAIIFSQTLGAADWGRITGVCLYQGTNLLCTGVVEPTVYILGPDGFMFDTGDLKIYGDAGIPVES